MFTSAESSINNQYIIENKQFNKSEQTSDVSSDYIIAWHIIILNKLQNCYKTHFVAEGNQLCMIY